MWAPRILLLYMNNRQYFLPYGIYYYSVINKFNLVFRSKVCGLPESKFAEIKTKQIILYLKSKDSNLLFAVVSCFESTVFVVGCLCYVFV